MSSRGEFTGQRWVECRCGKVWEAFRRDVSHELVDLFLDLAEKSLCRSCEAEATRSLDMCPQTLTVPGGASGCRLTWHHSGRCEPFPAVPIGTWGRERT